MMMNQLNKIPRELLVEIFTYYAEDISFIPALANVSKEWREIITQENDIYKLILPFSFISSSIIKVVDTYTGNTMYEKLRRYFQSQIYLQCFFLFTKDSLERRKDDKDIVLLESFSKLMIKQGGEQAFLQVIDFFGIHPYNTYQKLVDGKQDGNNLKPALKAPLACNDELIQSEEDVLHSLSVNNSPLGDYVLQASFAVENEGLASYIPCYFITYRPNARSPLINRRSIHQIDIIQKGNDTKTYNLYYELLVCPLYGICIENNNIQSIGTSQFELIEKMTSELRNKIGKNVNFITFEKIHTKRSKAFKLVDKKEEIKTMKERNAEESKGKRFEFWFGSENDIQQWIDSITRRNDEGVVSSSGSFPDNTSPSKGNAFNNSFFRVVNPFIRAV
ncbi:hypothetical protein ABK040_011636 [Willaertia magna]